MARCCGRLRDNHPAKRHPSSEATRNSRGDTRKREAQDRGRGITILRMPAKMKGEPQILREIRSGFRLTAQTPSKRLNLPVTILRGITRSHPEHGS